MTAPLMHDFGVVPEHGDCFEFLVETKAGGYDEVPASERPLRRHSPTRHIYHSLKLLQAGADVDRAAKHLADCTDFQNLRGNRLAAILSYLQEITATNPHWDAYRNALEQLAIGVEHYRG
ncbi:MAG: hypothetical protein U5O69_00620 [Candidatus Competibacteraceae bacterium]|nr:hypothetical protein [Candidatus Competibacteraceae bacterium]